MIPHAGTPAADHVPSNWRDKIIHARLVVGGKIPPWMINCDKAS
jgi:hypothetical protein